MKEEMTFKEKTRHGTMAMNMSRGFAKLIDDKVSRGYQSQLSVNKPFASNEFAAHFSVCNPRLAQGKNYIIYTVVGEDCHGRFEIHRRFKEFYLLRSVLTQRHPGMYVPPVPPKKMRGNTN